VGPGGRELLGASLVPVLDVRVRFRERVVLHVGSSPSVLMSLSLEHHARNRNSSERNHRGSTGKRSKNLTCYIGPWYGWMSSATTIPSCPLNSSSVTVSTRLPSTNSVTLAYLLRYALT